MEFRDLSVVQYHNYCRAILSEFEGNVLRPYNDSESIITIGIGINIEQVSVNLNKVLVKFGFDLSPNSVDQTYISQIRSAINASGADSAIRTTLDSIMSDRAAALGMGRDRFELTPTESVELFDELAGNPLGADSVSRGPYEQAIHSWEQNNGLPATPVSIERAILFSLSWNNASTLLGPSLAAALANDDRAEAWYEIRYGSNGGSSASDGIAARRYAESEIFGLFDEEAPSLEDALFAMRMLTKHSGKIANYENDYSDLTEGNAKLDRIATALGVSSLGQIDLAAAELQPAIDKLVSSYTDVEHNLPELFTALESIGYSGPLTAPDISAVWVAAEKTKTGEYVKDIVDRSAAGNVNDLIFGNISDLAPKGDFIPPAGPSHNDTLKGGAGNDWFVGGKGADPMDGGSGIDTVTYADSPIGVTVDLKGTGTGGEAEGDTYTSIENVIGSAGNDTFLGNDAQNIFYGAGGTDTADYSTAQNRSEVKVGMASAQGVIQVTNDGDGASDTLISIEKLKLTDKADLLKIESLTPGVVAGIELIDFGANPQGAGIGNTVDQADTIDVSALGSGVEVHFENSDAQKLALLSDLGTVLNFANAEGFKGTNSVDHIFGGDKLSYLDTGGGNDIVQGTSQGAEVHLGAGQDKIIYYGKGAVIETGQGADIIGLHGFGLVTDLSTEDKIWYTEGKQIFGGYRFSSSENPWAFDIWGNAFGLNGAGELLIGKAGIETSEREESSLFVSNFANGLGGMNFFEILVDFVPFSDFVIDPLFQGTGAGWAALWKAFNTSMFGPQGGDPLVLDLDGDGLELQAMTGFRSVPFDFDRDQFIEPSGWVSRDDGFLVRDLNGNGLIDDAGEMFGTPTQTGFSVLGAYDVNIDGKIDGLDAIWTDLRVWQDANGNGVTDAGELKTLAERGITSISLAETAPTGSAATNAGHTITGVASYTLSDGTLRDISNVVFNIDNYNTTYSGGTTHQLPLDGLLPELKGTGTLKDLRLSMQQDPALLALVQQVMPTLTSPNLNDLREAVYPVLQAWAGPALVPHSDVYVIVEMDDRFNLKVIDQVYLGTDGRYRFSSASPSVTLRYNMDDADPTNDSTVVIELGLYGTTQLPAIFTGGAASGLPDDDGRFWMRIEGETLDFAERQLGQVVAVDQARATGLHLQATAALTNMLKAIDLEVARLAFQGPLASFFEGIAFDPVNNDFRATTPLGLAPLFENIFEAATTASGGEISYIGDWASLLFVMMNDVHRSNAHLAVNAAFIFTNIVTAFENVSMSSDIRDIAEIMGIPPDKILVGAGLMERDETGANGHASIFYLNEADQTAKGGQGSDIYVVGRDFGNDVIDDVEIWGTDQKPDYLRFAHYTSADITATRDGLDLVLTVNGTDNVLRIVRQFEGAPVINFDGSEEGHDLGIGEIIFADGEFWDENDIARAVNRSTSGDDHIIGTDVIDFLDGGLGNDLLEGGRDRDTYYFARGYGDDTINESPSDAGTRGLDYLLLGEGIEKADLLFSRAIGTDDLLIEISGTSDSITIQDQFYSVQTGVLGVYWHHRVEAILFNDGTTMDWAAIMKETLKQASTDGNDALYGYHYQDRITGGKGNDFLSGLDDGDTYVYNRGDGHDTIDDEQYDHFTTTGDVIEFGHGISLADVSFLRTGTSDDLVIAVDGGAAITVQGQFHAINVVLFGTVRKDQVEQVRFNDGTTISADGIMDTILQGAKTAGNDTIYGFFRGDRLDGGAGNDHLDGGEMGDTYVFGRGYGADTVLDSASNFFVDGEDAVEFGPDLAPADIILERGADTDDLIVRIAGTSDQLTLKDMFSYQQFWINRHEIEQFRFADGTVWTAADVRARLLDLESTDGNDTVNGFQYGDTLDGGLGNDLLMGRHGNDTYAFSRGGGNDVIQEDGAELGSADRILINGYTLAELKVGRPNPGSSDLLLTFVGTTDSILVKNNLVGYIGSDIEFLAFGDGTTLTMDQVKQLLVDQGGTDGDDLIEGSDADEILAGGLGNDTLIGNKGRDTYVFRRGDGNDTVTDNGAELGSADKILIKGYTLADLHVVKPAVGSNHIALQFFGTTDSIILTNNATSYIGTDIEFVTFEDGTSLTIDQVKQLMVDQARTDGNDTIDGASGNQTIDGGLGNDLLIGRTGHDTYVFNRGGGNDTVQDDGGELGSADKVLIKGYTLADLHVVKPAVGSSDIVLQFFGTTDSIVLKNNATSYIGSDIEFVTFEDGTSLTISQVKQLMVDQARTDGNDTIDAASGNQTIDGGLGNDLLIGRTGHDTYVFNRGGGNDTVQDDGGELGSADKILIKGYTLADLHVGRPSPGSNSILLTFSGTTDSLLLTNNNVNYIGSDIEFVTFEDGTSLTLAAVRQLMVDQAATAGNDTIEGADGNQTIAGGAGNDTLAGFGGDDSYIYARGHGHDTISETTGNGADKLIFSNINPSEVSLVRNGNDLTVVIMESAPGAGDGGSVLMPINLDTQYLRGVEQIVFADGTIWTKNDVRALLLAQASTPGDDVIVGFDSADVLSGGAGNDTLDGAYGADTMSGGIGDDIYIADTSDILIENTGEGTDTVRISANHTLLANFENLVLTGTAGNGTGNALDNVITGNIVANVLNGGAGNDRLDGGTGNDTMIGGLGNDTFVVQATGDIVTENAGEGVDTIESSVTISALAVNVENLILTGAANINGSGNAAANVITGNSGNNSLDGGAGADTLIGGLGNDVYVLDTAADIVTEASGEGVDLVQSSITLTLAANLENLTLTGLAAIDGMGNAADNSITGNAAGNVLNGGEGNDTLNGGAGADTLIGGLGNDSYIVDNIGDTVTETAGEGTDLVQSSITWALGTTLENLTLTGATAINGTGNALDNIVTGNSGNNELDGAAGADTLVGGTGNDTYFVDDAGDITTEAASAGTDLVRSSRSWTLSANLENLILIGAALNGTGNSLANVITGNNGNNVLDGGAGADTLIGGQGDDVYVRDNGGDIITEAAGEGVDLVQSSASYTLAANVENLTLTGAGAIDGTGNALDNVILGNNATNWLTGNAGNDFLDGGLGNDYMIGGLGNDTYVVQAASDYILEHAGEGTETVQSSVTLALTSNVENLTLTGGSAINGTGNALDNILIGNDAANSLSGGAGNDRLEGRAGNDILAGGTGSDTFVFVPNLGQDTISDFQAGAGIADIMNFSLGTAFDSYEEVMAATAQIGADTVITLDGQNKITLAGVLATSLVVDDFAFV